MKYLTLMLMLLPFWVQAQGVDRVSQSEVVVIDNGGSISTKSTRYEKSRKREVFEECEAHYRIPHQWGTSNIVECNWSENEAMIATLNYAADGVEVKWYNSQADFRGSFVVSKTRAPSEQGIVRDIVRERKFAGNIEREVFVMCYSQARGWQSCKRY